ncbi:hypothetical protein GCM10008931_22970 [Oceanobacillus oncorhynchi subsp. oncorhynchi]
MLSIYSPSLYGFLHKVRVLHLIITYSEDGCIQKECDYQDEKLVF